MSRQYRNTCIIRLLLILLSSFLARGTCAFQPRPVAPSHKLRLSLLSTTTSTPSPSSPTATTRPAFIIHWKGECEKDYSVQFRQLEFANALAAVLGIQGDSPDLEFINALDCQSELDFGQEQVELYNEAMQYVQFGESVSVDALCQATERCSLVHALYQVVAMGATHDDLKDKALANGGLDDMTRHKFTWCLRARQYGPAGRHSHKARSMTLEQQLLVTLAPLLKTFVGPVNLAKPDCKIYMFDGLLGEYPMVLARRRAVGPITSGIAPNTRICITNTPLPPIAAYTLCNVARISPNSTVLDPYAGSCTILLASAVMAVGCATVGIEIAHDGLVNRDDIVRDFASRNVTPPVALIQGDCTCETVRDEARAAIHDEAFDVICTDPPYGVRESLHDEELNPLDQLFMSVAQDRNAGKRLLKMGGRIVAFVPVTEEETLEDNMPSQELMENAGLELEVVREQVLNDRLSRWLVAYRCIR
jgi:Putative RNA methylase family UPF0020